MYFHCVWCENYDLRYLFVFRKRGKKGEKNGKGLRHFSMKVCEKVQKKGVTTYNEVADELVAEFSSSDSHMSPNDAVSAAVERHFFRMIQTLLTTNRNMWKWSILHSFLIFGILFFPIFSTCMTRRTFDGECTMHLMCSWPWTLSLKRRKKSNGLAFPPTQRKSAKT